MFWFPSRSDWVHTTTLAAALPNEESQESLPVRGTTLTPLRPSGKILVDGEEMDASSQDGFIEADQPVLVVDQRPFGVIVRKE